MRRAAGFGQTIIDLVRTGVIEVFAFQIDLGAAKMFGQPFGEIEGVFRPT